MFSLQNFDNDLPISDFYLARQPILNRQKELWAYELLFRSGAVASVAHVANDLMATSAVISHVAQLGIDKVLQEHTGFLNVDAAMLLSDEIEFIPANRMILEILEHVQPSPELLLRIADLHTQGYRFALDDVVALSDDVSTFLPFVNIIKIEITCLDEAELRLLAKRFKDLGKKILAEKVETAEQFSYCIDLGFDYFQGYFFSRPVIISGKKLSVSEQSLLSILILLNNDVESNVIEQALKRDSFLSLNLLRLVNTPAVGMSKKIGSVGQAMLTLGRWY